MKARISLTITVVLAILAGGVLIASAAKTRQAETVVLQPGQAAVCATCVPCATATPTATTIPPTPTDTLIPLTNTPQPPPTNTPEPGGGVPFGPMDWIPDGRPYTLTRLNNNPAYFELARQHGVKAFATVGGKSSYTDPQGCFDLSMWQANFDRRWSDALTGYLSDSTLVGLYAMDEPHDWSCGPSFDDLDAICAYVHSQIPALPCGFNAPVSWLAQGAPYQHIDFLFTQTNFVRVSDWAAWAQNVFAAAQGWHNGPVYLSINADIGSPTDEQVNEAAIDLCASGANGVMMWKWSPYVINRDLTEAIEFCAGR